MTLYYIGYRRPKCTGIHSRQGCSRYMALPNLSVWAYGAHTVKGVPALGGKSWIRSAYSAHTSTYPRWELSTAPSVTPPIPFALLETIGSGSVCGDRAHWLVFLFYLPFLLLLPRPHKLQPSFTLSSVSCSYFYCFILT